MFDPLSRKVSEIHAASKWPEKMFKQKFSKHFKLHISIFHSSHKVYVQTADDDCLISISSSSSVIVCVPSYLLMSIKLLTAVYFVSVF